MNKDLTIHEEKRIAALRSYDILDSPPEQDFNELTKLATEICHTPISLVSLIDESRQWFKSNHGLSIDQTHRDLSFCAHAIDSPGQTMVVTDSSQDNRFAENPLVKGDPHIIFYAGVPLVDSNGFALGSFCVIDHTPRRLTQQQLSALRVLAKQVVRLIETRKLPSIAEFGFEEKFEMLLSQRTQEWSNTNQALSNLNRKVMENNRDLKKSNLGLQQYAFIASHDLQEPLRKIQAFSDLIFKRHADQLGDGAEYILKIQSAASRMSQLVNNLLTLSKISANGQLSSLVSMDGVMQSVLQDLELAISETGAIVKCEPLPPVQADHTQLCQVFQNLISNSLKFRKHSVPMQIEIRYKKLLRSDLPAAIHPSKICDSYHLFEIADNGIGFDQHQAAKIFKLFSRLHNTSQFPGTGIGLAICEKVVTNYGGAISAEGQKGSGAVFSVYLPV